jgi:hypothetical protein
MTRIRCMAIALLERVPIAAAPMFRAQSVRSPQLRGGFR